MKIVVMLTGEGVAEALDGAAVVVDVSNSPSFEDMAVLDFFETSTRNFLDAEASAGVGHHALSVVGTDALPESGYLVRRLLAELVVSGKLTIPSSRSTPSSRCAPPTTSWPPSTPGPRSPRLSP